MRFPNLKALRLQFNYKQEYVAELVGLSQPEYSKLETGQKKIDAEIILQLCKLYKVDEEILLYAEPNVLPTVIFDKNSSGNNYEGHTVPLEILEKLMDNYTHLINSVITQQQTQGRILDDYLHRTKHDS